MASELIDRLMEHLARRDLFHIGAFAERAGTIMRAFGGGMGWEYGPDFENPELVAFAIAIKRSLKVKEKLDRVHGLPISGDGFRIVSGLLPRDADQMVVWEGAEIEAGDWTYEFERYGNKAKILISAAPEVGTEVIESMVMAEVGEVNYAAHIDTVIRSPAKSRPFRSFAASFVEQFPSCAHASLLARKVAGVVRR